MQWEAGPNLTEIYVDGDACPVRDEVYRVPARLRVNVFVVSTARDQIRPPDAPNVRMVLVSDRADATDDWIAERVSAVDVCVTSDPAGVVLTKTRGARRLPDRTSVDRSEHRKRARRS
jgi:uncharacterized protein YaiI (UPF0178 family)